MFQMLCHGCERVSRRFPSIVAIAIAYLRKTGARGWCRGLWAHEASQ